MLNSDMKAVVGLLIANIAFVAASLLMTPPQFVGMSLPIAIPFVVLFAVFAAFCLKEKRRSYGASMVLGMVDVVVISVAQRLLRSQAPVVFRALLIVLPVLLALKSFEVFTS